MKCPECKAANPEKAIFCMACGAQLKAENAQSVRLRQLQNTAPQGLRRKMQAAREQLSGERKPVTILFTDIVGSTAIAETMDPEDWREVVAGAHRYVSEAIYKYEGTITQLLGDGVYAFFGAPITHEDDPERAILAALDIQANMASYRSTLSGAASDLQLRVGINTGEVVIGDIGTDMHVEYLAFGDAVNVAARLESSAEPGAILISEGTHRLVGQQFPCEAVTGLKVRGKRKPLTAFRVTGPPVRIGRARGVEALETVFIGRSEELKTLQACLATLDSGTGSVVTIEGEAGLGKSRLLAEFRASIPPGKARWVEGHCLSFGGSMPYMLWIDLLSELLGIQGVEGGETIARCYKARLQELAGDQASALQPYLSQLLSIPTEQEESIEVELLDRAELRKRTFQAARSLLEAAAKKEPFVLVYEDLHWADPTSLELLSDLIADVLQPVLILCTFRPGHSRLQDPAWKRARERAGERHHHLKLDPFGPGESRTLVEGLLGSCDLPPTLQERIETRAEGNPFFVEEVIRSLIDAGDLQLDQEAACWKLVGEDALVHIPDTLEGVLLARIDRLGQETKRVLQIASVIGRTFLRRLLLVLTEESKELDKRLGELQTQEMIREYSTDPELEYIFKHHLFQEACYRTLLKKERLQYHRRLAQAIEGLFPEWTEENPAMLAYHWKHAGEWERALDYYIQAGIKAQIESSLIEAIELYQEALGLAVYQFELEHEAQIRMKLGLLYNTAHQFDQAQEAYLEAFNLWEKVRLSPPEKELPPAPHPFRTDSAKPYSIDPAHLEDTWSSMVVDRLYSGLVEITRDHSIAPLGARRWEILDHGKRYRFFLRKDVHWSDDRPVTAEDYLLGWERFIRLNPEFFPVDIALEARNPYELEFRMASPLGIFLYLIPYVYPNPLQRTSSGEVDWEDPEALITNGAFRLQTWKENEIRLDRNPNYHGRMRGNAGQIVLRIRDIYDTRMGLELYLADQVDLISLHTMDPHEFDEIQSNYPEEFHATPISMTGYMQFMCQASPMDDRRIRRAIVMALDREEMARQTLPRQFDPPTGGFIPPSLPAHSPGIGLAFDPDEARRLLDSAGYPLGEEFPRLRWLCLGAFRFLEGFIRDQLDSVLGISVEFTIAEPAEFFKRMQSEHWHILGSGFSADYPDAYSFLGYVMPWDNPRYNQIIHHSLRQMDEQIRWEWYRKADKLLMEEGIVVPLAYGKSHYLMKPWISAQGSLLDDPGFIEELVIHPH